MVVPTQNEKSSMTATARAGSRNFPALASPASALRERFAGQVPDNGDWLQALVNEGLDDLPLPGGGATLRRWQALAAVGEFSLSLAKLYEGHTDALAIRSELGDPPGLDGCWGVWAAEAPHGRTTISPGAGGRVVLNGRKCWCSGAATLHHALLTAWHDDGSGPQLVRVSLDQPGISVNADAWEAVGMAASASLDVGFKDALGDAVGKPGQYLSRAGFWQGGAGIAACWYGGAVGISDSLRSAASAKPDHFKLAALGKVDLALARTAALLREAAQWIDTHPGSDASAMALAARLAAEQCATEVLHETGRALGATPFCRDAKFARAAADLPVFIRQSHAERDHVALAERSLAAQGRPWAL